MSHNLLFSSLVLSAVWICFWVSTVKAVSCPSIRFPVCWDHTEQSSSSDTATAQLGQTSPRAESTCREGPRFTQQAPVKSRKKDQAANKISAVGCAYPAKRAYFVWEGEVLEVA